MASRNQTRLDEAGDIDVGEELDNLEQLIERCKVLYEQHFMGIQKIPPSTLHRQAERRMLKLTQLKMKNTALRFRFTTLSQKYGAYNTYWRRTMRAIEQGRYVPHLTAAARRSQRVGKAMPDELLMKMPKRLREKLLRDRAALEKRADREEARRDGGSGAAKVRQAKRHQHVVEELGGDEFDFDAMFDAIQTDDKGRPPAAAQEPAPARPAPAPRPAAAAAPAGSGDLDLDASFDAIMSDDAPARPTAARPAAATAKAAPARPKPTPSRPAAAPAAAARRPTPRPVAARAQNRDSQGNALPPGMSEHQTRDLFDKYVKARKLIGERVDNVSYAKLMRTLNKQAPTIMKQHKASAVEFNVVIKDDRVVLKAKPKK